MTIREKLAGCLSEAERIDIIHENLLSWQQMQWLVLHGLSIADLLNGRFPNTLYTTVVNDFFNPWNKDIGSEYFHF